MKVPNKLSKMLSTAGEKAAYDNACKKLLSNKIILAWIMKSCLQEYRECAIQEIAEKYIEGDCMFLKFQYIRMKKLPASEKRMILQDDFGIQMEMDLESEVTAVGHVLDDVAQRNYEKGVCESLVSSIKTLTETMNWSVDQAMDALKISEEDKEEIRKKYNIG